MKAAAAGLVLYIGWQLFAAVEILQATAPLLMR